MAKRIFITATNTDIGKTYCGLQILEKLSSLGYKVGVYKPIETGVQKVALDASALYDTCSKLNENYKKLTVSNVTSYTFELPAAPYVAKKEIEISLKKMKKDLENIEKLCDVVLIEGAGGLLVPVQNSTKMIDLINFFKAKPLLITSSKLGSINDTLLSMEALENRNIDFEWAINLFLDKESFYEVTYPYYKDTFTSVPLFQENLEEILQKLLAD